MRSLEISQNLYDVNNNSLEFIFEDFLDVANLVRDYYFIIKDLL
jgi:hypothetical protein